MIRMGCLAGMGDSNGAYNVLVGRPEGKNHLENLGLDGTILLKWIYKKVWARLMWRRIEPDGRIV